MSNCVKNTKMQNNKNHVNNEKKLYYVKISKLISI